MLSLAVGQNALAYCVTNTKKVYWHGRPVELHLKRGKSFSLPSKAHLFENTKEALLFGGTEPMSPL
jgi:hypothetical protein